MFSPEIKFSIPCFMIPDSTQCSLAQWVEDPVSSVKVS